MLYLVDNKGIADSAKINKEPFTLKDYTDSICIGSFVEKNPQARCPLTNIFLKKDMKINLIIGRDITFDNGGDVNTIWNDFNKAYAGIIRKNKEEFQQLVLQHTDAEQLKQFNKENALKLEVFWKEAVLKNADNAAGAGIFKDYCTSMVNPLDFDPICKQLKYASLFPSIEKDREHYKHVFRSAAGKPFIDFKGKDSNGNDIKFSDLAGKGNRDRGQDSRRPLHSRSGT